MADAPTEMVEETVPDSTVAEAEPVEGSPEAAEGTEGPESTDKA